jgi:hypothetical protein
MPGMPPRWYTRIERAITFNWQVILIILALLFFLLFPVFYSEPLDDLLPYEDSSRYR